MSIANDINTEIPEAMRAKNAVRLSTLRNLKAAFISEVIALKKTGSLSDDEELAVIRRLVKQRRDSADQFRKGGREELATAEEAELKILEGYLPAQMTEAEVEKVAKDMKAKLGIMDKSKLGQFIGAVMVELKNKADGSMVKRVVESLFQ